MKIITFIQDLVRGTKIVRTTKFLKESDFWSRSEIENYQLEKLQKLIRFSYEHVSYYRSLFDKEGLKPEDITRLDDIQKIPVLTKDIIRKEYKNLLADNVNIKSYKIKEAKTGGTTGIPLKFYKNTQTRNFTWGAYDRWYSWMGLKSGDREAVIWGDASVLKTHLVSKIKSDVLNYLSHTLKISSFNINKKQMPIIADKLIKFKPLILRGYLSGILEIAKYFKENNLSIPSLKAISSTTETLLPIYRHYIEDAFNVKMYDQYGCVECCSIAFECCEHNGLHINEEHCIIETLNENDNRCHDVEGRIIMTDLDNYATPFIRYENGDTAIMSTDLCSCGRNSKMLKEISGRTKDVVYLKNGNGVHGVFFTDIFYELGYDDFKYFTRFQIYQNIKGDFTCRLEITDITLPKKDYDRILSVLSKYGNNVKIELLDKLQNDNSGKFRYVISEIEK